MCFPFFSRNLISYRTKDRDTVIQLQFTMRALFNQRCSYCLQDDENVMLNGDDVMYLLPSADNEYSEDISFEDEEDVCRCVTITENLEFEEPNLNMKELKWNRNI